MPAQDRISRRTMGYIVGGAVALVAIVIVALMFQVTEPDGVPAPGPVPSADDPNPVEELLP
ncbi:hypothetical protein [Devosia sp. RR2S18]|uniref:hypothetical protein n=1 Tax=Devosia rhizosphaerae TaxID=3049774 RepID=UPI00254032FF|nr:hypothetical protein [Devosia sp. RR2S18]WIJ26912.1 hypothetical protein QOV41_09255 [Devosia sp. RR2S18]